MLQISPSQHINQPNSLLPKRKAKIVSGMNKINNQMTSSLNSKSESRGENNKQITNLL